MGLKKERINPTIEQFELDTPAYNLSHMDSLYSDINRNEFRVKIAFPFIWATDFNGNNQLEFDEFKHVKSCYSYQDKVAIAVNYECIDSANGDIYLHFKLYRAEDGQVIYWMKQPVKTNVNENKLTYFFLDQGDDTLNNQLNVSYMSQFRPDSIRPDLYIYQVFIADENGKRKVGGYADSLMFINYADTIPPRDTVVHKIQTKKELKKHHKEKKAESKKDYASQKDSLKAVYKEDKKLIEKGETIVKKYVDI